jgi:hypothetical protein
MPGEMERLFSAAGRVYVLLRRETNRMIDVEWVIANAAYAREVVQQARATGVQELMELAERIEQTHPLLPPVIKQAVTVNEKIAVQAPKYISQLR